jgi:FtsZ-interacting cell division protein ZipA
MKKTFYAAASSIIIVLIFLAVVGFLCSCSSVKRSVEKKDLDSNSIKTEQSVNNEALDSSNFIEESSGITAQFYPGAKDTIEFKKDSAGGFKITAKNLKAIQVKQNKKEVAVKQETKQSEASKTEQTSKKESVVIKKKESQRPSFLWWLLLLFILPLLKYLKTKKWL